MKRLTLLLAIYVYSTALFSQSITNTLGTSGLFIVKDASNDYLTLSQSTGQVNILNTLRLENTTNSTTGVIFKGLNRFIHNYGDNTFLGINAGNFTLTTANANTGIGQASLNSLTTGDHNTAVGYSSLSVNSTGNRNTALGYFSGNTITTGSNLTSIGFNAQPSSATATDEITLGNVDVQTLRCNTQTITSLSDARDKRNITDLDLGIDFLMKIKPRLFNWDKREWYDSNISDGSKMKEAPTAGFIAQELDEVQTAGNAEWLNLVLKNNPEKWEATPGNLLPIMVKAIQELKAENERLRIQLADVEEIKEQIAEIKTLKAELKEQIKILKASNNGEEVKFSTLINDKES